MEIERADVLLWSLRAFKTRPLAKDACEAGHVRIGEHEIKPGRKIHPGEILTVKTGMLTRTIQVNEIPKSRLGPKLLPDFMTDLTPAAEYERVRQASIEHALARERGAGRPTKKDRREISRFFGQD